MSDFPAPGALPLFISSANLAYTSAYELRSNVQMAAGSITWVANLAMYIPLSIPFYYPVRRLFWVNGSTVTGNCDVGIYTVGGVKIVSTGSVAQSGASAPQYTTPSPDLVLSPGSYYLACACDTTTNRLEGSTTYTASQLRQAGILQQASALPLPATMTPAAVSNAVWPLCGITRTASGF